MLYNYTHVCGNYQLLLQLLVKFYYWPNMYGKHLTV